MTHSGLAARPVQRCSHCRMEARRYGKPLTTSIIPVSNALLTLPWLAASDRLLHQSCLILLSSASFLAARSRSSSTTRVTVYLAFAIGPAHHETRAARLMDFLFWWEPPVAGDATHG